MMKTHVLVLLNSLITAPTRQQHPVCQLSAAAQDFLDHDQGGGGGRVTKTGLEFCSGIKWKPALDTNVEKCGVYK